MICLKLVDRSFKVDPADHDIRSDTCQTPLTRMHKKKKKKETCYPRNLVLILSSISFLEFLFILTQDTEDREGSSSRIQGDFV